MGRARICRSVLIAAVGLLSLAPLALEAQQSAPPHKLSEVSIVTLELFRELYEFRNDRLFHRVGFSPAHKFHDWLDRLEALRENQDGRPVFGEIGIVPGDLYTLATDYMDNQGRPADDFTRTMERRLLEEAEAHPAPDGVEELAGVDPEWMPAAYKLDGQDTLTMDGELSQWVYIHLPGGGGTEQMIATAMQAALDVYQEDGGDVVFVSVFKGPTDDYPVEKVWLYPRGCPDKGCVGGVWTTDSSVVIPAALIESMPVPDRR